MNKPLRRIAIFCGLLILALLIRTNWLQYVQAEELATRKENRRVQIAQYATERGNIIVEGQPITGSEAVNGSDYKFKRKYLDGPLWAPVTGFASQAFGSTQLESLEDGILTGNDDRLFFDRTIGMFTGQKKQGGNVVTTLNAAAQKAAFTQLGNKKGAVAAIDPRTGAILALASTPSYDPSRFAGNSKDDEKAWVELKDSEDKNLVNRALRETYPPGSTFKVVTAAAALEHGVVTDINAPTDTTEPYLLPTTQTKLPNSHDMKCDKFSLSEALRVSCNTVFANMSDKVTRDKMVETAQKFGFNNEKIDTPVRAFASVYDKTMDRPGNALSGIGQYNTAATPLQMAMVAAAVANDGKLMKPYMVDQLTSPNLDVIEKHEPQEMSRPLSAANAQKVQQMMVNVVDNGTGKTARIPGVTVGGKTGTAQHGVGNKKNPYAWFISYAETDKGSPVAVAVVIEDSNADREDISGGGLAAPVAKAVMEAVLKSQG
ncbi:peptidoglycan D,D-transpeptidase FtsI family protein [Streptomyces bambusae]|uniref:Penicillin-binding protein 2 n=1 Tax=Streptomyces bambusae TaxID=1550616 RepID=A0ABS6Z556_9ACTN|nr:penicillin-binding transpeptidase domain-containing protein [Streptomyces bambusae]MBW5482879.1 penicillin-binding protein 2 [Streptomyces bambusae]